MHGPSPDNPQRSPAESQDPPKNSGNTLIGLTFAPCVLAFFFCRRVGRKVCDGVAVGLAVVGVAGGGLRLNMPGKRAKYAGEVRAS